MKHVDQESLHAKNMPRRDPTPSPNLSDMKSGQMQPQGDRKGCPYRIMGGAPLAGALALLSRVWTFFWHALYSMIQKMRRKRVPELRQMSMVECGFACLSEPLSRL